MEQTLMSADSAQKQNGTGSAEEHCVTLLEQELSQKTDELDMQRGEREELLVKYVLERILNDIDCKEAEISTLINATKGRCQKEVMMIVEKEVLRVADEGLWCPDYSVRTNVDQTVNCYTGSQWKLVPPSMWKTYVGRWSKKCGVPESLLMDTGFMKKLYDSMAHCVFEYRNPQVRKNEVWLNMQNYTLELKVEGKIEPRAHRKEDLFFYTLPYAYDPEAECPLWHRFLDRVLPEAQAQQLLGEFIGYILMRSHRYEKMLWIVGPGQNGKSTVLNVLEALLGRENVCNLSLDQLTNDQIMRSAFEYKLLNSASETGDRINVSVMKRICSGEAITMEQKYVNPHESSNYGKVIMATNEYPRPENTSAFFRRILILPFQVYITEEEKDLHLEEKLKCELPGILNWVLALLPGLLQRGAFTTSESSRKALEDYQLQSDNVRLFISEMLETSEQCTHGQDIFNAYVEYCKQLHVYNLGRTKFYRRLDDLTHAGEKKQNVQYFKLKLTKS